MTDARVITLTTDFGTRDAYVASMKGVILQIDPGAIIVDVSHEVAPQDIAEGAALLAAIYPFFPSSSIHVVVIDPGVGTDRHAIVVESARGTFIGPDNGVLAPALVLQGVVEGGTGTVIDGRARVLTSERHRQPVVSSTFHGRDIFAPAAAHIAAGVPVEEFGPPLVRIVMPEARGPQVENGAIRGEIIRVDRFGNAVSNISADLIHGRCRVVVRGLEIDGLSSSYQTREWSAIIGSTGLLEIARRNGSAAGTLGLEPGQAVCVSLLP